MIKKVITLDSDGTWRGKGPWYNAKVISPDGNYRIVGWSVDVKSYIEENKITGLVIFSVIKDKKARWTYIDLFRKGKDCHCTFFEPKITPWHRDVGFHRDYNITRDRKWRIWKRQGYNLYDKYELRKLPNKWCKLYEDLLRD